MNVLFHETPIGLLKIVEIGGAITEIRLSGDTLPPNDVLTETPLLLETRRQLTAYFAGKRKTFDLPLSPKGTLFQQKVWAALQTIPYGETRSYKQVAELIGNPKACRAVGLANNKNPIILVIPCHRVIGANGKLVGYACGLDVKEKLLTLENTQ